MEIQLTKGQRKQARDDWHLRWNQALKQTGLDHVYGTSFRFELTTNKVSKATLFTAIGFAYIQNIPQTFTITGFATGEQKNGRACFELRDLTHRTGPHTEDEKVLDAEGMPPLKGDICEIGPAILNRIFDSLRAQLPQVIRTKEDAVQDRRACDETLKKLVQAAVKKCHAKGIAFQFIEAYRFFSDTRVEQPYYAKAVFKINEQHSDIRFKFKRIGTEQEFVLESVTVDGRDREINFRVLPFTVQNAIVVGMRNAIKWIKEGFKMDSSAIEQDKTAAQKAEAANKPSAPKKPAAKRSPAKPKAEKPDFKQLADARMGQVKKTAKVIENGELKDAPKSVIKVVKKKPLTSGGIPAGQPEPVFVAETSASKSQVGTKPARKRAPAKPPVEKLNADQIKLIDVFAVQLEEPASKFTMQTLLTDSGADELDLVEIVMQIEEEFELELPANVEYESSTIGDLYNHVVEKQKELAAEKAAEVSPTKARRASKAKVEAQTGKPARMTETKPKAKGRPEPKGSANFDAVNDGKLANRSSVKPLPKPKVEPKAKTKAESLKWDAIDEAELVRMRKQLAATTERIKVLERAKENGVAPSVQVNADVKAKAKDEQLIADVKTLALLYGFTFSKAKKMDDFADKFTLKRTYMNGTKVAVVIHYDDSAQHRFIMETDKLPKGAKQSTHTLPVELKTKAQMLAVLRKLGSNNK